MPDYNLITISLKHRTRKTQKGKVVPIPSVICPRFGYRVGIWKVCRGCDYTDVDGKVNPDYGKDCYYYKGTIMTNILCRYETFVNNPVREGD